MSQLIEKVITFQNSHNPSKKWQPLDVKKTICYQYNAMQQNATQYNAIHIIQCNTCNTIQYCQDPS